jgi:hypothetical protein
MLGTFVPSRIWILGLCALSLTIWNGAAQASEGAEPATPPQLVALEPLRVPIVDHGAMVGRLELRAMWQARDGEDGAIAEQRLPALRAALVSAAADHARLAATPGQAVDPEALARRLESEAARRGFSGELLVLEAVTRGG